MHTLPSPRLGIAEATSVSGVTRDLSYRSSLTVRGKAMGLFLHFQPTVLAGCSADIEIMREEVFSPVLPIQIIDDLDEAIALANDCDYGLYESPHTHVMYLQS